MNPTPKPFDPRLAGSGPFLSALANGGTPYEVLIGEGDGWWQASGAGAEGIESFEDRELENPLPAGRYAVRVTFSYRGPSASIRLAYTADETGDDHWEELLSTGETLEASGFGALTSEGTVNRQLFYSREYTVDVEAADGIRRVRAQTVGAATAEYLTNQAMTIEVVGLFNPPPPPTP